MSYISYFAGVFEAIGESMTGFQFSGCDDWKQPEEALVATIGVVGAHKGAVQIELAKVTAWILAEAMIDETVKDQAEMMLYIGELANTFCGNAINRMNDVADGRCWLTPPVVLSGRNLQVLAPGLHDEYLFCTSALGDIRITVSFEGV